MSSPITVPYIINGQVADIPVSAAAQAKADGHTPAVDVRFRDGTKGTIPLSAIGQASQDGVAITNPMQVALHSMPQNKPQVQAVAGGGGAGDVIGSFFKQLTKNTGAALGGQYVSTQEVPSAAQAGEFTLDDFKKSLSAQNLKQVPSRILDSIKSEASTLAPGDTVMGRIGSGAANLYSLIATGRAGLKEPAVIDPLENRPTPASPAEAVTNAINPPSKQMAGMDKTVEAQLPNIIDYARQNKLAIRNRQDFMNVARQAGEAAKNDYRQNVLGPNENVPVDTTQIPKYSGDSFSPNSATLGQLESRLSKINAQLTGKYEKGAGQALPTKAALSAGDAAQLDAEANGIRSILNSELAQRNGMTPQEVAAARAKGASMASLADRMQMALNAERRLDNIQANAPADLEVSVPGMVNRGMQNAVIYFRGKPADRAIRDALSNAQNQQPNGR